MFATLNKNIQKSLKESESAKGKDLVLIVGKTGAGKSTLVNYMLRFPMVRKFAQAVPANPSQEPRAKMGGSFKSITTYPMAYEGKDGFVYCDCPGFEDTRGREARICNSVVMEAVVKRAKSIKSLVIVMEWSTIIDGRGTGLREAALTLAHLFKHTSKEEPDTFDFSKSILFVITKTPPDSDITSKYFIEQITDLIGSESEILKQEASKLDEAKSDKAQEEIVADHIRILWILKLIQLNPANTVLVNVFDKGETREQIITRLKVLQPIPLKAIDFSKADDVRLSFCEDTTEKIVFAVKDMEQIRDLPQEIKQEDEKLQQLKDNLKQYEAQLADVNSGREILETNDPIVLADQATVTQNQVIIESNRAQLRQLSERTNAARFELSSLDLSDETEFWRRAKETKRMDEIIGNLKDIVKNPWDGLFSTVKEGFKETERVSDRASTPFHAMGAGAPSVGSIILTAVGVPVLTVYSILFSLVALGRGSLIKIDLEFEYNSIPFIRVSETTRNGGKFNRLRYEPDAGEYKANYESDRGRDAVAEVVVYGQKRDKPEHRTRIRELRGAIPTLEIKSKEIQKEMKWLQETNDSLGILMAGFSGSTPQQKKQLLENLCRMIGKQIETANNNIGEKKALLAKKQEEFTQQKSWYVMVIELSAFLNFNNPTYKDIVEQFVALYRTVISKDPTASYSGSGSSDGSVRQKPGEKIPGKSLFHAPVSANASSSSSSVSSVPQTPQQTQPAVPTSTSEDGEQKQQSFVTSLTYI